MQRAISVALKCLLLIICSTCLLRTVLKLEFGDNSVQTRRIHLWNADLQVSDIN